MVVLFLRVGALIAALLAAVLVFVAAAYLDAPFWMPATLALAAFLITGYLLLSFTARFSHRAAFEPRRPGAGSASRSVWIWLVGGALAYAVAAQLLVGRTPLQTVETPVATVDTQYWTLSTGSRIAYQHTPAAGDSTRTPIVILHDGPGMPALPFFNALGRRPHDELRDEGHDVYYYDQVGAGLSSRLDLTTDEPYTVARHVADMEEIRIALNAPKLILIGTGWGATLAVHYLMDHADRVEKLVLESPTALWPSAWPDQIDPAARAKMSDVQASALAALQRPPLRLVLGRMMSDVSPSAAHRFINDWEGDQWWTRNLEESIRRGQPNYTCKSDPGSGVPAPAGLGFFAYTYTIADAARLPDPRPALKSIDADVLIMRGTCDYTDWRVSTEYLKTIRGSHYVAIPAAGHFIWLEQEAMYHEVVRAFLRDEAIPLAVYNP